MTPEQLVVLVLLAVAFAAGWIARGAQDSRDEEPSLTDHGTGDALARALTAYRATRSTWVGGSPGPAARIALRILRARVEEARGAAAAVDDADARRESLAAVGLLESAVGSFEASLGGEELHGAGLRAVDALADRSMRASRTGRASKRAADALADARRRVQALLSR
jgi:hypothetical protein